MTTGPTDPTLGAYPAARMRRNRDSDAVRRLVAENRLSVDDFIWPVFVLDGEGRREAVESMPGVARLSIDLMVEAAKEAAGLGIPAMALFPVVPAEHKTEDGAEAANPDSLVCRAVGAVKAAVPELMQVCDVALDP